MTPTLSSSARFDIGASVTCAGHTTLGQVKRVVADPLARCVTHLVIGAHHRQADDRLVPIAMAHASGDGVVLSCGAAEFQAMRPAVETEFISGSLDESGYGPEETYLWPNYGLSLGGMGTAGFRTSARAFDGLVGHAISSEQVPVGDVQFRRGCDVIATDGTVGHLHGLITDPDTSQITHLLLQHGHLWGHREMAIPIRCVTTMEDNIQLNVSTSEVDKLPDVAHAGLVPQ
jgi:sporulation protein YlmC with PRC-barrel domain